MPQVISQEAVRATVEERLQESLVFRQAFRELDASGINSNTIKVPNPDDVLAEPAAIAPGAEYPATREDYTKVSIDREKYGQVIKVPDEDAMDNVFDLVADHVDLAAREMAEFLDGLAFTELSGNLDADSPVSAGGSADDNLTYDDIMRGVRELEENAAQPDIVFVGPQGKEDLMTSDDFTRASDLGDDVIRNGVFGRVGGIDVSYSNTGDITAHNAIIVDSDRYGYEATWMGVETEQEDDFDTDTSKYKVRTYKGFKAMKPEAAVEVEG